ncbi:hypothetical protein M885DRAFT_561664 [Pelagophyceae sp. CCMP2097]|nr:hypothetical protein M885DRAFT_561664 [Pelagophyceae sp. CCMP2097]
MTISGALTLSRRLRALLHRLLIQNLEPLMDRSRRTTLLRRGDDDDGFGTFDAPAAPPAADAEFGAFGDATAPAAADDDAEFGVFDDVPAAFGAAPAFGDFGDFDVGAAAVVPAPQAEAAGASGAAPAGFGDFGTFESVASGETAALSADDAALIERVRAAFCGACADGPLPPAVPAGAGVRFWDDVRAAAAGLPACGAAAALPEGLCARLAAALSLSDDAVDDEVEAAAIDAQRPSIVGAAPPQTPHRAARAGSGAAPAFDDLSAFISNDGDHGAQPDADGQSREASAFAGALDDATWDFLDAVSSKPSRAEPNAFESFLPFCLESARGAEPIDGTMATPVAAADRVAADLGVTSLAAGGLAAATPAPAPTAAARQRLNKLIDDLPDYSFLLAKALAAPQGQRA